METSVSDRDDKVSAVPDEGRALPLEGDGLNLDVLYDLARLIAGSDREALELIRASLRPRSRHSSRNDERHNNLQCVLAQTYVRRSQSRLRCLTRLVRRQWRHGEKPVTARSILDVALHQLNPEERLCLILRERLGLEVAEIARITRLGSQRTNLVLFMARERLRVSLSEH